MIDYVTYQRIQHLHRVEQLAVAQIALAVSLDVRTVRRWLDEPRFRPRLTSVRPSNLDPYKAYICRLLEHHSLQRRPDPQPPARSRLRRRRHHRQGLRAAGAPGAPRS